MYLKNLVGILLARNIKYINMGQLAEFLVLLLTRKWYIEENRIRSFLAKIANHSKNILELSILERLTFKIFCMCRVIR